MKTPVAHRVRKHREQRLAQGQRRISAFVDTDILSFVDAYAQHHGLTKEETVRLFLRQRVDQIKEKPEPRSTS